MMVKRKNTHTHLMGTWIGEKVEFGLFKTTISADRGFQRVETLNALPPKDHSLLQGAESRPVAEDCSCTNRM